MTLASKLLVVALLVGLAGLARARRACAAPPAAMLACVAERYEGSRSRPASGSPGESVIVQRAPRATRGRPARPNVVLPLVPSSGDGAQADRYGETVAAMKGWWRARVSGQVPGKPDLFFGQSLARGDGTTARIAGVELRFD